MSNFHRMRRGDPPLRYTGWTVPVYSRQRWDPENNSRSTGQNASYYNGATQKGRPNEQQQMTPYFDASRPEPEGTSLVTLLTSDYQPPAYPAVAQLR